MTLDDIDMNRYDIIFGSEGLHPWVAVSPHFCRELGCFGTDPDHGYTWEQAREEVAKWHEEQAQYWRTLATEPA